MRAGALDYDVSAPVNSSTAKVKVVALSGGVGGAKLCLGLQRVLPPGSLSVIVNTGDDFDHLGLRVCPDIDSVLYTLAGLANTDVGWGRRDETWTFMRALERLGGETWFRLGDADLALHVERTRRLAAGEPLESIVCDVARRFGIPSRVLPMTEAQVRTIIQTSEGEIGFQDYFVRQRCAPAVRSLRFDGASQANIGAGAAEVLSQPGLAAIVLTPSNPYLSIDPILALPRLRESARACDAPIIAVSPLLGGSAVKGPAAKIMRELGLEPSPLMVAQHYEGLIDGFVLDRRDSAMTAEFKLPTRLCDTLMITLEDRERVARAVLDFAAELRAHKTGTPPLRNMVQNMRGS
jgi:LPPG:FO 2-phospho-L-lactate transferase